MKILIALVTTTILLALPLITFADDKEGTSAKAEKPEARTWVTEHSARIGGQKIDYTVTAGTMLMKNADDEPHALFGYTAYVAKGGNQNERPIMFA